MNSFSRTAFVLSLLIFLVSACNKTSESVAEPAATTKAESDLTLLPRSASPHGARVFFINPTHGETVSNPIRIDFGIQGMTVVKAGNDAANSGHHHLLIDTDVPDKHLPIPADEQHIHFGDGSTTTEITLTPGKHRLQLILGDHLHIPHDPAVVSKSITITVE
jgi:hypothetical protein